jgi:hypothetical protein
MAKTIQAFLEKYHKQSLLKGNLAKDNQRKLDVVNAHEKIYSCDHEMHALMLDIYYQSTVNKNTIQQAYEKTRNNVFDIWQNLDNLQKNHLLSVELTPVFDQLPHFTFNETTVYVAFFDELLNSLIDKRTAIFELPQYFKLYKQYKDRVIAPEYYQHLPFLNGFSECAVAYSDQHTLMLYHFKAHVFYVLQDFKIITRLPFDGQITPHIDDLQTLANHIKHDDVTMIKQWLIDNHALSLRAKKATNKKSFKKIEKC